VTGQNGSGQYGRLYGKNGMDKMVASFGIDYNSNEFNTYYGEKIILSA